MSQRQYEFTDKEFSYLQNLAGKLTGIHLADNKRELVYGRLTRRLRALKLSNFTQYIDILEQKDPNELEQFTNMITTNLTSFFRENHHFEFMTKDAIPELMKARADSKRLRIWSAGCSTGEEPYSIAMAILSEVPQLTNWDFKILATDLDSEVIAHASNGVYGDDRIQGLDKKYLDDYFDRGSGANSGKVRVRPEVRKWITFRRLNLMDNWPMSGPLDIIFCRNVVIYFDKPTQTKLFDKFCNILADDGRLFVGHSEALYKVTNRFELLGKTIYKKAA
jgi:chemotaxis protein methyltransferase CheR